MPKNGSGKKSNVQLMIEGERKRKESEREKELTLDGLMKRLKRRKEREFLLVMELHSFFPTRTSH